MIRSNSGSSTPGSRARRPVVTALPRSDACHAFYPIRHRTRPLLRSAAGISRAAIAHPEEALQSGHRAATAPPGQCCGQRAAGSGQRACGQRTCGQGGQCGQCGKTRARSDVGLSGAPVRPVRMPYVKMHSIIGCCNPSCPRIGRVGSFAGIAGSTPARPGSSTPRKIAGAEATVPC